MKRIASVLLALVLLCGCAADNDGLDRAMSLRAQMVAKQVEFDARILADYGEKTYEFAMACTADTNGKVSFTVTEPKSIGGISGKLSASGGKLTFDDTALAFPMMADGLLSPVSAPWVLVRTLRSGYLSSCCQEDDLLRLSVDDSYQEDALHMEIWLDGQDLPKEAEIYWQGRRLLTIRVSNFRMV